MRGMHTQNLIIQSYSFIMLLASQEEESDYRNVLEGTTKIISENGRFVNVDLYFTAEPATLHEIEISTNAFDPNPKFWEGGELMEIISVSMRNCCAGEEFTDDGR
jgi:hypothetical protein